MKTSKEILTNSEMSKLFDVQNENDFFAQKYIVEGPKKVEAIFLIDLATLKTIKATNVKVDGKDISSMYLTADTCEALHNKLQNYF